MRVPDVVFKTRVRNDALPGPNPFEWKERSTADIFNGRKIVLFAVPGAFTPVCSSNHLPRYEALYDDFMALGVDEVVCLAVNDAFVMFQWGKKLDIHKVTLLPDGNAEFTEKMKMEVDKSNLGFGHRSWRYSMFVDDGEIVKVFSEPGMEDNCDQDPLTVSDADTMLNWLKDRQKK